MPQPAAAGSMQRRCCRCAQQPRARRRRAPGAPSAAAQLLLLGLLAALPAARAYAPHVSYSSRQKLAEVSALHGGGPLQAVATDPLSSCAAQSKDAPHAQLHN